MALLQYGLKKKEICCQKYNPENKIGEASCLCIINKLFLFTLNISVSIHSCFSYDKFCLFLKV